MTTQATTPPTRSRRRLPAPLRHGVVIFLALLVVEYLVIPKLVVASKSISLLSHINIGWLIAGIGLEFVALLCYALLTRTLLPNNVLGLGTLFRIDLATTAVAHVIPGGTAGSASLGYRLFTSYGVQGTDIGFAMATQGMGSAVVLNIMLWLALLVSIPLAGVHRIYIIVALVGIIAILAVAALVYAFTRGEEGAAKVVRAIARRLPRVSEDRLEQIVRHIGTLLRDLARHPDQMKTAVIWAAANWGFDAASLWAFLAAFHQYVDPVELFAAYGIANVLAVIPITPGGLGFVEASSIGLLVSFGVPNKIATLGVLGWRLVNFWAPIPVGAGCYISLRVRRGAGLRERRRALSSMTVESKPLDGDPAALLPLPTSDEAGERPAP
jgi:uncharacterized protein (TIRG00374 family)